jgi:hypothetical protein
MVRKSMVYYLLHGRVQGVLVVSQRLIDSLGACGAVAGVSVSFSQIYTGTQNLLQCK